MQKLYLYLASRKKEGIKLITVLKGESTVSSRVNDLSKLKLPIRWQVQIQEIIYDNIMHYEPWIESAKNYSELRKRLKERGFERVSGTPLVMLHFKDEKISLADTSSCKIKKTMLRKKES